MAKDPAYKMYRDKNKATTKPVQSVKDLKGLWDRDFGVYRMVIVRVTAKVGSVIDFEILDTSGAPVGAFKGCDLDDGRNFWGDLPSTAQLVDPASADTVGYLGINEDWLADNLGTGVTITAGTGDPPKIPRSIGL